MKQSTDRPTTVITHLAFKRDAVRYDFGAVHPRVESEDLSNNVASTAAIATGRGRRVVVGVGKSAALSKAFRRGIRITQAFGTSVEAVSLGLSDDDLECDECPEAGQKDARDTLQNASVKVFGPKIPVRVSAARKRCADRVPIEASKGAEMLVLGAATA